jgi:hypothetical protein
MPPYVTSESSTGFGAVLSIGPVVGTATPTYTLIGECSEASPSGREWGEEDVTNFQSPIDKEYKKTNRDPGKFKLSGNRVATDAGQIALEAAMDSLSNYMFKLVFPLSGTQTVSGDTWTFNAGVMSVDPTSVMPDKVIKFGCDLRLSGSRTIVAGT